MKTVRDIEDSKARKWNTKGYPDWRAIEPTDEAQNKIC